MPSVFGCISSGSRYGNVPNELVHRAGPPFLDNHYRGYQFTGLPQSNLSKIQKHFQNVMLVGMASEISKNYTYKCVDRSRHNGIKGAMTKCVR